MLVKQRFYTKDGKVRPITPKKKSVGTLQKKTVHLGVPNRMVSSKTLGLVYFNKKASGDDVKRFRRAIDPQLAIRSIMHLSNTTPIEKVSKEDYDKIRNTLNPLPFAIQQSNMDNNYRPFIVTDGKRSIAVDTQGYDYPRYKSPVYKKNGYAEDW